jgi:hypothetical protein
LTSVGIRSTQGKPVMRAVLCAAATGLVGLSAWILLPNGEYRPIQPGERGTLQGSLVALTEIPGGRPGLSEDRRQQLGGAPFANKSAGGSGEPPLSDSSISESDDRATTGSTDAGSTDTGDATSSESESTTEPEGATTPTPTPSPDVSPTPSPEVSPTPTPEESPESELTPSPTPSEEPE